MGLYSLAEYELGTGENGCNITLQCTYVDHGRFIVTVNVDRLQLTQSDIRTE